MLKIFILENCPHCKNLKNWIQELYTQDARYQEIEVEYIEERKQADIANQYDYYYVPSIYMDERKVHEGVASKEVIENIFKQARK